MPEAQPLALLRANIDRNPEVMRRVLTDAALRKAILGVSANDEKKAIKAFALQNAENALKTKPKVCPEFFCSKSAVLSLCVSSFSISCTNLNRTPLCSQDVPVVALVGCS